MNKKYDFYDSIFDYQFDKAIDELEEKEKEKENQTIHGLQTQIACLKKENCKLSGEVADLQKEIAELKLELCDYQEEANTQMYYYEQLAVSLGYTKDCKPAYIIKDLLSKINR